MSESDIPVVDPESVMPAPQPGELIASVLTLGPVPWFIKRRRPSIDPTEQDGLQCVCGAQCRCCRKRTEFKSVQSVEDKERMKAERKERRAKMERDEQEMIEREEMQLKWLKWYFYLGCVGLPLVHFVTVIYFIPELRAVHNSNFRIRQYCYLALIVGSIESLLWVVWFIIFQIYHNDTSLNWFQRLSILNSFTSYNISSLAR